MAGRYRDNGDGTVTDVQTGLQWMRFSLGQEWNGGTCTGEARKYTWQEAFDAAETLNRQGGCAGYRGWRVPTKEELQTLISGKQSPTIDRTAFPDTPGWWYWSSSVYAYNPDDAWGVNFGYGYGYVGYDGNHHAYHVRLVRGGQ